MTIRATSDAAMHNDPAINEGDECGAVAFTVTSEDSGARLDAWLARQCADINLSRSRLKELILAGAVSIDDTVCEDPSRKVQEDMRVTVLVPPPEDATPVPENIPINIVYEDEHLLVINKQAGLVVHPAPGHSTGTLVNALLYHCGDSLSGIGGVRRPGIVHRLDKDTTGLMVAAKSDAAHHGLSEQLAERTLSRHYKALVWKVPQPRKGKVDQPIGRHHVHRQKMTVNKKYGRAAVTHYTMLENYGAAAALLECRLESGRTHQVRVRMSHIGHPLVGDPVYGGQPNAAASLLKKNRYEDEEKDVILGFARQALHACRLSFIHPVTEAEMTFEAPYPDDFQQLINNFKSIA